MSGETLGQAAGIEIAHDPEIPVRFVQLWLCDPCIDGTGDQCHTPGCALFINRPPDLSIRNSPMVTILDARPEEAAQQPQPAPGDLGQVAYEAYVQASDGVSLFSGQPLPAWDDQAENIRMAWRMSAGAVLIKDAQEPVPATELAAAMAERERIRQMAIECHAVSVSPSGRMLPFEEMLRQSPEENAAALLKAVAALKVAGE